ncbi:MULTISPECIES: TonB-dependent receptor [Delftia]|uniref:TonB-dependent siderophore receptor n=1 Tax=Delftia lacustris TaxID=558537 RepID=A0A7T2YVK6_9BURK|nr:MULTISPECIES: TonB-dependent siderophore receptor [Delftia]EPD41244.1 iron complex outermembrane recepter protein [Delftia acidovorans CCUG 15835]KAA9177690.1 TonB-dependent siderophore receptor [Delftia sp. BR1]QPS82846.1 TonB-dependent siderophore receptor [Delftia lacustris]
MRTAHLLSRPFVSGPQSCLFSVFAAALVTPAYAQDATADERQVQLAPLTVSGQRSTGSRTEASESAKYAKPLLDVPQTITVVPGQVLQEQNALSLQQALSNVSGITFNAGEGGAGSGDSINIRGFSANANLQIDGLRDSGQKSRSDLFNTQSVEVIKGPNSVFGGAGTSGGSINMISKQPKAHDFTEADAGLGTASYRRLTLDTNRVLAGGKAAMRLNLMGHDSDVAGRDTIFKRRWGVAPSLALGLNSPTRLTLGFFHQSDDNLPDYGVPAFRGKMLEGVSRNAYFGWRNLDREKIGQDALTAKIEHDFASGAKLQNLSRYSRLSRDTVISASHVDLRGMQPGYYRPAGPQAYGRDAATTLWINQTNLTQRFDTGVLGHTLVTGFEIARETYDRTTSSYSINRQFPAGGYPLARPPGYWTGTTDLQNSGRNETRLDTRALYATDSIALGPRWDLNLGLRYDWIDGRSNATTAAGVRTAVDSSDGRLSGRTALSFKPADNGRIYLAYGTAFNPSAEFLVSTGSGLDAATASLAPEKNTSLELGTKWDVRDRQLALTAALFQVDKTNAREQMADGSYLLAGEQRVRGLELGAAGKVTPQWDLFANYTFMASKTLKSLNEPARVGQALGNTPRHSLNLWTTYALPQGWTVGYGARFVGTRNVTSAGDGKLSAYWVHSAMVGYELNRQWKLRLNLDNIGNKAYVAGVRQRLGEQSRSSAVEYGEGRTVRLTALYQF